MEASFTANLFKKKAERPSTEKVSLGRRCEALTVDYLEKKGWKVVASNIRFRVGEIDLLAEDPKRKRFIVAEVRSKSRESYRPAVTLSRTKIKRLKTLVQLIQIRRRAPVHLLLIEVLWSEGEPRFFEYWIENY